MADRCTATFDRRFIPEESFDEVREEISALVAKVAAEDPGRRLAVEDRMAVHPVQAPGGSPAITALSNAIRTVRAFELFRFFDSRTAQKNTVEFLAFMRRDGRYCGPKEAIRKLTMA